MAEHEPRQFVTALGAKLATRSRHVCLFLGAGVGRACGLPDVAGLQRLVLNALDGDDRAALEHQLQNRNLEGALSRIRRIATLISGAETVDGLTGEQAKELDKTICRQIVIALNTNPDDNDAVIHLAGWAARANYHLPVELFTVNYDLVLEAALEQLRVPYFDGFIGNINARFHTELVESLPGSDTEFMPSFLVRLWKLHGSVNWIWNSNNQIVRLGQAVPEGLPAAIYPSDTKYDESRRVPFVVLQDRFRRALHQPETLMLISGYSFGDDHLNELIYDAATRRERSEFIAFMYSDIPTELAERAELTPNLQVVSKREAIVGGIRANWVEPDDDLPHIWSDGEFKLTDFRCLARHLARSTNHRYEGDGNLRALLQSAIAEGYVQPGEEEDEDA